MGSDYGLTDVHTILLAVDSQQVGIIAPTIPTDLMQRWRTPMKCQIVRVSMISQVVNPDVTDFTVDLLAGGVSQLLTPLQLGGLPENVWREAVTNSGVIPKDTEIKPNVNTFTASGGGLAGGLLVQVDYVKVI